jgi:hypothetical protein
MKSSKRQGIGSPEVLIPAVKGLVCGAIGVSALAYAVLAKGAYAGFWPLLMFFYSIPSLFAAIWYLTAAFLLARTLVRWRLVGALLDAIASLAISAALVMEGIALSDRDGPFPVLSAVAAIWAGLLFPVFLGAFRRTSSIAEPLH